MLTSDRVTAIIPVTNLARSTAFYRDRLGLRVSVEKVPGMTMFECGGGSSLGLYERPPTKSEHTLACFTVQDIRATMQALKAKGVTFEDYDFPGALKTVNGVATIEGYQSAWFKDPDGNILSVTQYPS